MVPDLVAEIIGYYRFTYQIKKVHKDIISVYRSKLVNRIPKLNLYVYRSIEALERIIEDIEKRI
jgi:hypothetical protein